MAGRLIMRSDDLPSRARLLNYFVRNLFVRLLRRDGLQRRRLDVRIGGLRWLIEGASSQLGGIHDVVLAHEYDAFPGFVAPPGGTTVDIGANVGAYSLWQWTNMNRHGTIVAVEASPSTSTVLHRNLDANQASVVVVEAAVWSLNGTVEFVASDRSSSTAGVSETLDLDLVRGGVRLIVEAMTLDALLDLEALSGGVIDVLKLDVEGAELEVLSAAAATTFERIRRLVVEVDERTWIGVQSVLAAAGFELVGRHRNVGYFSRTS